MAFKFNPFTGKLDVVSDPVTSVPTVDEQFTESTHGFTTGDAVYWDGTNWAKAKADAEATLGTHIADVIDTNTFNAVQEGTITVTSHGFTLGAWLYVSDATAGALTETEPTTYSNPIALALDANTLMVFPYRASSAGVSPISTVTRETPSGDYDGADTTYTLASTPIGGSESIFVNGVLQNEGAGNDYTISGTTITFATAPVSTDIVLASYLVAGTSTGNADTVDNFDAVDYGDAGGVIQIERGGWKKINTTLTYSSADDPTYIVSTGSDLTGIIGVGMRIRFTNNSTTFYGIVTAITSTTMTLYGGTDYDVANSAITVPVYSEVKSPIGFPLDPTKWTASLSDTSNRQQSSPTAGTVYNLGSLSLSIPIGVWNVSFEYIASINDTATTDLGYYAGISTANNSFSDNALRVFWYRGTGSATQTNYSLAYRSKVLSLSSKTSYYVVMSAYADSSNINIRGDLSTTIIRAVCAYL